MQDSSIHLHRRLKARGQKARSATRRIISSIRLLLSKVEAKRAVRQRLDKVTPTRGANVDHNRKPYWEGPAKEARMRFWPGKLALLLFDGI
jgi:hypothetical protein